jgi:Barrel-sandwich domain of CusB or HlyD membrane-fusion/GAF domain
MSDLAIQRWLEKAIAQRGDVESALVVLTEQSDSNACATHWPKDKEPDPELLTVAQSKLQGPAEQLTSGMSDRRILTRPVSIHGKIVGALAMRLNSNESPLATSATQSNALLKLMQLGLQSPQLDQMAVSLTSEMATMFACDRVWLGAVKRRFSKVAGVSHGTNVGQKKALVRIVSAAMDEALDQAATVVHPQNQADHPRIALANAELLRVARSSGSVLSVPMFVEGRAVGAVTLERSQGARFDAAEIQRIEAAVLAIAPLWDLRARHQSSTLGLWSERVRSRFVASGERSPWFVPLSALVGLGLVALVLSSRWSYEISVPTRLEGQIQRAVVAPVDSFLKTVHVRAGDLVKKDQLLLELSDEELHLEQRRLQTEVARHETSFAEAQAKQDRTQLVISTAHIAESQAQLDLVEQQLIRTQLRAPFDAQIIQGDLNERLGAPIKRGDLLLTLTPSRELRVMLEVDERDVGQLKVGTQGALKLSALPEQNFGLVVERVMPVAKPELGRNMFLAEARISNSPNATTGTDALRPGLQGLARLDVGQRPLYWLIGHRISDWLRLKWWAWFG